MVDSSRIVSVATTGATTMLITTVIKKVITFALRQVLFRQANPTLIGAAEIQLELLLSSLLFLTRESIRMAVMRVDGSDPIKFQQLINLSWLSPLVLTFVCAYVILFQGASSWSNEITPLVIQLYCLGALFEACGEPFHNAFRNCLNISAGANAETVSVFLSSVVTVVTVTYLDLGILGYGLGQVVKGLFDFIMLVGQAISTPIHGKTRPIRAFLPRLTFDSAVVSYNNNSNSIISDSNNNDRQDLTHSIINKTTDITTKSNSSKTTTVGMRNRARGTKKVEKLGNNDDENNNDDDNDQIITTKESNKINVDENIKVPSSRLTSFLSQNFDLMSLNLTVSSYSTCLLKHMLTQSDKIILSFTASNYDQGIYAVTHNYAALITRMVFYPLEESSRLAFAKCSVGVDNAVTAASNAGEAAGEVADVDMDAVRKEDSNNDNKHENNSNNSSCSNSLQLMEDLLLSRLTLVGFIGSVFVLFGTAYVRLFVQLFLSEQWRTQATVDSFVMFCYYIAVMGVNGISEGFVHSVASAETYRVWINVTLTVSSIVFGAITYYCNVFWALGTTGVIVGNIVSMLVRIGFNCYYIYDYFRTKRRQQQQQQTLRCGNKKRNGNELAEQLTNFIIIITTGCAFGQAVVFSDLLHQESAMGLRDHLQHVMVGMVCFISYVIILWGTLGTKYVMSVIRFNGGSSVGGASSSSFGNGNGGDAGESGTATTKEVGGDDDATASACKNVRVNSNSSDSNSNSNSNSNGNSNSNSSDSNSNISDMNSNQGLKKTQ